MLGSNPLVVNGTNVQIKIKLKIICTVIKEEREAMPLRLVKRKGQSTGSCHSRIDFQEKYFVSIHISSNVETETSSYQFILVQKSSKIFSNFSDFPANLQVNFLIFEVAAQKLVTAISRFRLCQYIEADKFRHKWGQQRCQILWLRH